MKPVKKKTALIISLSVPVIIIVFIAGSIYLLNLFFQPKYNFIYSDIYHDQYQYSVRNGKLVENEIEDYTDWTYTPKRRAGIYMYEVKENKIREISLGEAQKLDLDTNNLSPDGFELIQKNNCETLPAFFDCPEVNQAVWYLKGHNITRRLNLRLSEEQDIYFYFIGWVK